MPDYQNDLRQALLQRMRAAMGESNKLPDPYQTDPDAWDRRPDGTQKGRGFLGLLPTNDGSVMSEFSVADSERLKNPDGSYADYPTLVPGLTPAEMQQLLSGKVPDGVYKKAEAHALRRKAAGKSLFAQEGEADESYLPTFRRVK